MATGKFLAFWRPLVIALALGAVPGLAHAEWRRAETEHFIVYSDGSERNLRDYAMRLERFDALVRSRTSLPPVRGARKLPVYLVANRRDLAIVRPGLPDGVRGFYSASERDIRAVVVRGLGDDILLHEYAHHFMFQNFPGGYPGWFTEGFAEYFMTATVNDRGRATIGYFNPGRLHTLNQQAWIPMDTVLKARPRDLDRRGQRSAYYAQSWLLLHYMFGDPERVRTLDAYLTAVVRGVDPVEALQTYFALTPETLERTLRGYLNGRMTYLELDVPVIDPQVVVTRLPDSADDTLLFALDVRDGAPDSEGPGLLARARAIAVEHPQDPLILAALARAELEWGEPSAAEAALARILAAEPDNGEALTLLAETRMSAGDALDDPTEREQLYRQARGLLARAMNADPTDYRVYRLLAHSRQAAADYPTYNDLETWRLAVAYAPQVLPIRGEAAEAMLRRDLHDEATALLLPVANDPHGGGNAERARDRLARIQTERVETGGPGATP